MFGVAELDVRSLKYLKMHWSATFLIVFCAVICACHNPEGFTMVEADLAALAVVTQQYQLDKGYFPQGTDIEISQELSGESSDTMYIDFPKRSIDSKGRFIDPWGTPYVFHQRSDRMIIWSFGRNRTMDSAPNSDDHIIVVTDATEQGAAANP